jgi:trans-2,3-dihydro-3-hydroxyanthranilate isomerase
VVRAEAPEGLRLLDGQPADLSGGRPLTWLDVFTATPLTGNGLAVVHAADGIDDATMLRFARETQLSETTYVQSPPDDRADYVNRIWTMGAELPFAGHPSLGTAVAVAALERVDEASYVQVTPSGRQPVEVERAGDLWRASMVQNPPRHLAEVDPAEAFAAVGLSAGDAHPELPCQVVSTGQPHLMMPVRDPDVLDRAAPPSFELLDRVMRSNGCVVAYLAAIDTDSGVAQARGFFADPGALTEDPATGSAAGPLGAYLNARCGMTGLTVHQGVAMGRPSVLRVRADGDCVEVAGDCVIIATGSVFL